MKHVVGFSGGIDSQACARWVLNRYPAEDVILLNSQAGRNEHTLTLEHIRWYSENIHPVHECVPLVKDILNDKKSGPSHRRKAEELGLTPDDELTFGTMIAIIGRPPMGQTRFCTTYLKLTPQRRWISENITGEFIRYSGLRRDESLKRRDTCIEAWDDFYECKLRCPIADWTKKMCFDYIEAHGEKYNPLYKLGFKRVGCAPCINSGKDDIRSWAQRFPEMIDKIREWESMSGHSFFPPTVPGAKHNRIDDVVAWSMTERGGVQPSLLALIEPSSCESIYGLCE